MDKNTDDKLKLKQKLNNGKRGNKLRIGSLLIFLFILVYIPSFLNWVHGRNISSDILRIGLIEQSVNADGIIARDEILLKPSTFDGKYIPEVYEGERVPAFSRVATVLNKSSDSLLKDLEAVNLKIVKAQNEKAQTAEFFSADMAKVDKDIDLKVQNMIAVCNSSSFLGLGDLKNDIDKLMQKKAEIAGEGSGDSHLAALKQQKTSIQGRIDKNTGQVETEYSGLVSYIIDGYENVLTPKSIKGLTIKYINAVKNSSMPNEPMFDMAHSNKPLAKIIRGSDIFIAAVINQSDSGKYKIGSQIGVRINDLGFETKAVVSDVTKKEDNKCIISIKLNKGMNELISLRKVNVDIINSSSEGLKVPLKCLRDFDQAGKSAWITLIKANCATKRKADIVSKDSEFAIICTPDTELKETVNLYDTYILNPDKIKEGEIVQK